MDFDKSRVYTALNADELKIGSKILVAYDLATLKNLVEHISDVSDIFTLQYTLIGVHDETYAERFKIEYGGTYALAYLLSESKLKWTDLKVKGTRPAAPRGRQAGLLRGPSSSFLPGSAGEHPFPTPKLKDSVQSSCPKAVLRRDTAVSRTGSDCCR